MTRELGGFAVLSAGPIAFLVILLIGAIAVRIVARRGRTTRRKWVFGALAAMATILVPTWDEIAGRVYFRHLCATQSGLQVFKQVTLASEYRELQLPKTPWSYRKSALASLYPYRLESLEDIPGPARIYYVKEAILDRESGAVLGTATDYFYRGGWAGNTFSPHVGGGGNCHLEADYFERLLQRIFVA